MNTRRANSNDVPNIIRFYYRSPYSFFRGTLDDLEFLCSRVPFWIAEKRGNIVGFIFSSNYDRTYAWISGLGISTHDDEADIGLSLLDALEKHFSSSANALLVRETSRAKTWANPLFLRKRFKPICTILAYKKQLYPNEPLSCIDDSNQIRFAKNHELEDAKSIDAQCFPGIFRYSPNAFAKMFKNAPLKLFATNSINGNVVGFLIAYIYQERFANITRIAILPEYRQQGLGLALMASCIKEMRNKGVRSLTLNTQIDNFAARRLYEKLGFNSIETETVLAKQLAERQISAEDCI